MSAVMEKRRTERSWAHDMPGIICRTCEGFPHESSLRARRQGCPGYRLVHADVVIQRNVAALHLSQHCTLTCTLHPDGDIQRPLFTLAGVGTAAGAFGV